MEKIGHNLPDHVFDDVICKPLIDFFAKRSLAQFWEPFAMNPFTQKDLRLQ